MIVIIPSCLTSAFAADTKASDLGLDAVSKAFEQSLTARGKHSPSRTWLRRWKTDSWMQLLFSRTFQLSHGSNSLHSWLEGFCPLAGHASPFQQQENEKQRRTSGGSSTSLQMELQLFDQECFLQKTSKDSCPQRCQMDQASSDIAFRDWSAFITKLRQAYSARLNAVRRTKGSESSSWPTTAARDHKGESGSGRQERKGHPADTLSNAVAQWPSPVASEVRQGFQDRSRGMKGSQESLTTVVIKHGPPAPASSSTDGSRSGLWQTATVSTGAHRQKDGSMIDKLDQQVKSLATPATHDGTTGTKENSQFKSLVGDVEKITPLTHGKLNPRWVETLMGLPVGWTMPSCVSPVTIERTSCDSSAMESFRRQQNEPFEY